MAILFQFGLVAFTSIFVLVDPVSAVPAFVAITDHADQIGRRRMARQAALTCFIVLTLFALTGPEIFRLFGITLPAFEIAGGLILGLIGLDMLQARRSHTKETPGETQEGAEKEDPGIIPLGVPMLAGPGAISSVMVLMSQNADWRHEVIILTAIAVSALISFFVLAAAHRISSFLHRTGIRIMTRMMGLLLTAIAVQFVLNGLRDVGLIR
ncbi:MAG: multiple antibiotic resistance protein [Bryobacterales bacterium]|jgi:multiple antibiotic resistance protein|nr:multiple antibiotic resistance protein [Bryobacterales bacterium]